MQQGLASAELALLANCLLQISEIKRIDVVTSITVKTVNLSLTKRALSATAALRALGLLYSCIICPNLLVANQKTDY